ncbi:MAG: UvrD-helicase domain-containing protein [Deltaproteobacteria bacterium]|nr:UvrD-helicase domain-containing protein [Deltaproteobacteria bacterium]
MFFADLHVHSKYSRATAKTCDLEHLALWACKKGIAVVGTGDFTHPAYLAELKDQLVPAEPGLYRLRAELERSVNDRLPAACRGATRFMLSVEISTIYKKGERTRKVHHLVYVPDLEAADRVAARLGQVGNIASDGRPILGLDSRDLLEIVLESGPDSYLVPAHIWTPWFSAMGSKSGFDSIADCYGDLADHIFAVETGLSSDPEMNWQVSSLDGYRLVSNSDAHSPPMVGREANLFEGENDYFAIRRALETGDGYGGTVELFPEEGKYHLDGHRNCEVRLTPEQTRELGGRCPVCGKPVTVGVMNRVIELADRPPGQRPSTAGPVRSLVPLPEILGELHGVGPKSKTVSRTYEALLSQLGPELAILSEVPVEEARRAGSALVAEALTRLRAGQVIRQAGYDGAYGVIRLFEPAELNRLTSGGLLFQLPDDVPEAALPAPSPAPAGASGGASCHDEPEPSVLTPASERTLQLFADQAPSPTESVVLSQLDSDQRAAAELTDGPVLIVAGPGSGKTRTLTHRIAHLVRDRGVPPDQCLAITFTRRAAAEMSERLSELMPQEGHQVAVCTFHRLGLTILQEQGEHAGLGSGFQVADEQQRTQLLAEGLDLSETKARRLLAKLSRAKRTGLAEEPDLAEALAVYQAQLQTRGWLDFDDLVVMTADLLERHPTIAVEVRTKFPWLSVDEYQDVDEQQVRLLRQLVEPGGNLCAIGDPDQAIYGFRGADLRFFDRFEQDFPGARVVQLRRNYRSSGRIVEAAGQVMAAADAARRQVQVMVEQGDRITIHQAASDRAEAEFVVHTMEQIIGGHSFFSVDSGRTAGRLSADLSFSDFAVLYRTEAQSGPVCEALRRSGMPFRRLSHKRLGDQPAVAELVERMGRTPPSGPVVQCLRGAASQAIGELTEARPEDGDVRAGQTEALRMALELLEPVAGPCGDDREQFLSMLALGVQVDTYDPRAEQVSLLTLHAAKGLEFPVVFMVGCEDGILPLRFGPADGADLAEERRLFYVGMTRAEQWLFLCHAQRRLWRGKVRPAEPSPFVLAIAEQLIERSATRVVPHEEEDESEQLTLF